MPYSGTYRVKNPQKYEGDVRKCKYRSLWERQVFRWLDSNPNVKGWSSEEVVIHYRCKTDGKMHRYYVDLFVRWANCDLPHEKCTIIEIKPKKECLPPIPNKSGRKSKRYLKEVMTYAKNQSKWEAARAFAAHNNMEFYVWHEDTIKGLGIKLLT